MNEDERSVWVRDFRWNTYENQQTAKLLASDLEYACPRERWSYTTSPGET